MKKRLRTAPFCIDAEAVAEGMLEMFSDEERVILRFGMLPARLMEVAEKSLREKFLENCRTTKDGDQFTFIGEEEGRRTVGDFSMRELVSEAMHEISLALYSIGDLVV